MDSDQCMQVHRLHSYIHVSAQVSFYKLPYEHWYAMYIAQTQHLLYGNYLHSYSMSFGHAATCNHFSLLPCQQIKATAFIYIHNAITVQQLYCHH